MRTLKYNGEEWYIDERSVWKRVRQWVIWIGGWEKANGKGWQLHNPYDKKLLMSPTPISLFGHRVTFYGSWWQVRLWRNYFVWTKHDVYISNDGTPPQPDKEHTRGFYIWRKSR